MKGLICAYFSRGPRAIVVQLTRKQADPHLLLAVEVQEPLGAVDVVERGKALDGTVDAHRVDLEVAPGAHQRPVRVRAGDENAAVGRR